MYKKKTVTNLGCFHAHFKFVVVFLISCKLAESFIIYFKCAWYLFLSEDIFFPSLLHPGFRPWPRRLLHRVLQLRQPGAVPAQEDGRGPPLDPLASHLHGQGQEDLQEESQPLQAGAQPESCRAHFGFRGKNEIIKDIKKCGNRDPTFHSFWHQNMLIN